MHTKRIGILFVLIAFSFWGSGCGTAGSGNSSSSSTYTVGGTISGLSASGLVLANGSQTVSPASGATAFTFPTALASGTSYSVTVQTQPTGETCSVSNGSGTVSSSNVTSVSVTCTANTYTIGGTISGLSSSGLVLANSSQTVSPASGATSFTFPTALASGTSYSVTVQTQPTGETCSVSNGSGTVSTSNVTSVAVACTANTYTVGGTISGLSASGLVLANGSQTVSPASGAISFTFPTALAYGASYLVSIATQPTSESCTVSNGSGTVSSSNVTSVQVTCSASSSSVTEKLLYSFRGGSADGESPVAGLIRDSSGNLYGTTETGGRNNSGTVFELTRNSDGSYTESILYSFLGGSTDGMWPVAGLIRDSSGNLYGTTNVGGADSLGTVFKLTRNSDGTYTESLLYSFQGSTADGAYPLAGVIMDSDGNLYGTAEDGGAGGSDTNNKSCGVVFKLTSNSDGTYTESLLYSFHGGTTDGMWPWAGLIMDSSGNLYGTTKIRGANDTGGVFKLTKKSDGTYTETLLYSFGSVSSADGNLPVAGLVADSSGNLYGTTSAGGVNAEGIIFKLTGNSDGTYTESILHRFQWTNGEPDGETPDAGLIIDSSGNLYGTAKLGSLNSAGNVFMLTKNSDGTYTETVLYSFGGITSSDGNLPVAGLLMDSSGNLYGTTSSGGTNGYGTVFEIVQ